MSQKDVPANDAAEGEKDVADDSANAGTRAVGGVDAPDLPDSDSTTGTGPSEEFVGRVAGQDVGYEEETGGERRKRWLEEHGGEAPD